MGAAEMGQATRRELALGLRSAEASLWPRHGSVAGGGGAGLGLASLNGGFGVVIIKF
jgi:hypothetical protein